MMTNRQTVGYGRMSSPAPLAKKMISSELRTKFNIKQRLYFIKQRVFFLKDLLSFHKKKWGDIWVLVLLCFSSCKVEHVPKVAVIEGDIVTRGTTNPATTKPLKMGLYEQRGQGNLLISSSYFVLLHEFYSDDKGHFELTYPLETHPSSYKVEIMEPVEGHFRSDHNKILNSNAVNLMRMELHPHSWLKFMIDNRNGGEYDYFSFVIEGYDRMAFFGNGMAFDYFLVPGADSVQIVFNNHQFSPWKQQVYRIYVEGQDTTEHIIIPPI